MPPQANLHIGDSDNDLLAALPKPAVWRGPCPWYRHRGSAPVDTANCDALVCSLVLCRAARGRNQRDDTDSNCRPYRDLQALR